MRRNAIKESSTGKHRKRKSAKKQRSSEKNNPTGKFLAVVRSEPDPLNKKALLIGYVFEKLSERGVDACLVGGEAVELYTAGQFVTGDIDITVADRTFAERIFLSIGFTKEGMIWLNEDLKVAFQIVARYPSRAEKIRIIRAHSFAIKVVGVEDLIIDRLVAAKYWRSNPKLDSEQATVLFHNFRKSIDIAYLKRRASEELVEDFLGEISKIWK